MLSREICAKCNASPRVTLIGGWYCLLGKAAPRFELSDCSWLTPKSNPIKNCPYSFEHAVFSAAKKYKKGGINKQSR